MRRGAKPAKPKVKAKPSIAHKAQKGERSRVHDLEKHLAEAQKREAEALEQQTATSEILTVIASSLTDTQPVFDAIAENAARLCNVEEVFIVLAEGDALRAVAGVGQLAALTRDYNARRVPISRTSVAGRAIVDRATIHIDDLPGVLETEFPEARQLQQLFGHRTILATPLLREDLALGAIVLFRFEVRAFSERQIELLKTFAAQAVIAIENVRLFKELEEKNRALTQAHGQVTEALEQQTATSEILRTIAHAQTDVQPVFDSIVRSAARLCHAVMASVLLTDGRTLYLPANYGSSPEALATVRARFPRPLDTESVSGAAILTRSVVHVPDVLDSSVAEFTRQAGQVLGYRGLVTVPMMTLLGPDDSQDDITHGHAHARRHRAGHIADAAGQGRPDDKGRFHRLARRLEVEKDAVAFEVFHVTAVGEGHLGHQPHEPLKASEDRLGRVTGE